MRAPAGKSGSASKSGPKKLEDLEAEGKLAMDRLEDIANYMGDYRDIVDEYAVSCLRVVYLFLCKLCLLPARASFFLFHSCFSWTCVRLGKNPPHETSSD